MNLIKLELPATLVTQTRDHSAPRDYKSITCITVTIHEVPRPGVVLLFY